MCRNSNAQTAFGRLRLCGQGWEFSLSRGGTGVEVVAVLLYSGDICWGLETALSWNSAAFHVLFPQDTPLFHIELHVLFVIVPVTCCPSECLIKRMRIQYKAQSSACVGPPFKRCSQVLCLITNQHCWIVAVVFWNISVKLHNHKQTNVITLFSLCFTESTVATRKAGCRERGYLSLQPNSGRSAFMVCVLPGEPLKCCFLYLTSCILNIDCPIQNYLKKVGRVRLSKKLALHAPVLSMHLS